MPGAISDTCYYITPAGPNNQVYLPSSPKSTCTPETRAMLTYCKFPSEGSAHTPLMPPKHTPPTALGAPLTLTELSWLEVARMCSLSGCQSRPWILERWAARYSTAVLGFCNRISNESCHFRRNSECPPYNSLLGAEWEYKSTPRGIPWRSSG